MNDEDIEVLVSAAGLNPGQSMLFLDVPLMNKVACFTGPEIRIPVN